MSTNNMTALCSAEAFTSCPDECGEVHNLQQNTQPFLPPYESRFFFSSFNETGDLTEFGIFPYLPPELRLQIWEHTIKPRVVPIFVTDENGETNVRAGLKAPAILSVCCESRAVALKKYSILPLFEDWEPHKFYFIPSLDTIYLQGSFFRRLSESPKRVQAKYALSKIEFLAVKMDYLSSLGTLFRRVLPEKWMSKNLKQLIVVRGVNTKETLEGHWFLPRPEYHDLITHGITDLRPITLKEEFRAGYFQSRYTENQVTAYLQHHLERYGGSSDSPIPLVKNLIEVVKGDPELETEKKVEVSWDGWIDRYMKNLRRRLSAEDSLINPRPMCNKPLAPIRNNYLDLAAKHHSPIPNKYAFLAPTFNYYSILETKPPIPTSSYYAALDDDFDDESDDE